MKTATAKDVHQYCDKQGKQLLKKANAILRHASQNEHQEKLTQLGFGNSESVVPITERVLADKIKKLKLLFPQHNILTEKEIQKVCNRYGLLFGPPRDFKASIPLKNQKEIAEFKFPDSMRRMKVWPLRIINKSAQNSDMESMGIASLLKGLSNYLNKAAACRDIPYLEYISRKESFDRHYKFEEALPTFFVLADASQFLMKNKKIVGKYKLVDEDPVVFAQHGKCFIQVSAWGDEAEKEEFKTPRLN